VATGKTSGQVTRLGTPLPFRFSELTAGTTMAVEWSLLDRSLFPYAGVRLAYLLLSRKFDEPKVVTDFNAIARALVGLVDKVRGISPTSRQGTQRTWGPWADDKHPGWQVRVLMDRVDNPSAASGFNISYNVQVRNAQVVGSDFIDFMTGYYTPSGNTRRGQGEQHLWVQQVRDADYPVDDLGQLAKLDLCYQTQKYPVTVHMFAENQPTAKDRQVTYDYAEDLDGSGTLFFNLTGDRTVGSTDLRFISRWLGSGAGRADAYAATLNLLAGTDCWGPDTVASMSWRYGDAKNPSESSLCVFAEPTDLQAPQCTP
jgi:hypothetical protein